MVRANNVIFFSTVFCCLSTLCAAKDRLIQHCFLEVEGRTYLDQPCIFSQQEDGSFSIGTSGENSGNNRMPFFAYVNTNGDGSASGYWNFDASSTHAQTDLGTLVRKGACWTNARAKVCAN